MKRGGIVVVAGAAAWWLARTDEVLVCVKSSLSSSPSLHWKLTSFLLSVVFVTVGKQTRGKDTRSDSRN